MQPNEPNHALNHSTRPDLLVPTVSFQAFGEGNMGPMVHSFDWSQTSIGPIQSWSKSLQAHVSMMLALPTAAIIFWGEEQVQIYNDGFSIIMGPRHPHHLGSTLQQCWPDAYPTVAPWMKRVTTSAEVVIVNKSHFHLTRHGFTEECYFSFTFSPLRNDEGKIDGVLQIVSEVTESILFERRTEMLKNMSPSAHETPNTMKNAIDALSSNPYDIRFACIFLTDGPITQLELAGHLGIGEQIANELGASQLMMHVREVFSTNRAHEIHDVQTFIPHAPLEPWPELTQEAILLPIRYTDSSLTKGVMVLGISPRLQFNPKYRAFLTDTARTFALMLETEEQKRRSIQSEKAWLSSLIGSIYDKLWFTNSPKQKKTKKSLEAAKTEADIKLNNIYKLQSLGTLFMCDGDLQSVLETILKTAITVTNADMGNVQLVDKQSGYLKIMASEGFEQPFLDFWDTVNLEQGTCGVALGQMERVIVEDVSKSAIFIGKPALDVQLAAGVRAVQSTPLISRAGKLLGIFSTHFRCPHRPDEKSLLLLDLLARQAADLIQKAQTEEAIRHSEEQFRALADNAQDCITRLDRNGRYVYANPFYTHLLQLPAEAIMGKTVREVNTCSTTHEWEYRIQEVFNSGELKRFDHKTLDGRWLDMQIIPELKGGGIETVLSIARDITERKELEKKLRAAIEVRDEFLLIASHELKTPVTTIKLQIQILLRYLKKFEEKPDLAMLVQFSHKIDEYVCKLTALIDDLLEVSRISAGKLSLNCNHTDVSSLVEEAIDRAMPMLQKARVTVEKRIEKQAVAHIDQLRIEQVITNLLSNVEKYAPGQPLKIQLQSQPEKITISVQDNGPGIPSNHLEQIFDRFGRVSADMTRTDGLGMGLYIARQIISAHDGKIWAEGRVEHGACFIIEIPVTHEKTE